MAQLSDDCFAFGGKLLPIEDAVDMIVARVTPLGLHEFVDLPSADGRILARDFLAPIPLPPFTNSAVDGYAVRHGDLGEGDTCLPVAARIEAGAKAGAHVVGAASRIFTGAVMPDGADTVFMQEDVRVDGELVVLPPGLKRGANVRPAGEDIAVGEVAIAKGKRLMPQDIALAAALGARSFASRGRLASPCFPPATNSYRPAKRRRRRRYTIRTASCCSLCSGGSAATRMTSASCAMIAMVWRARWKALQDNTI